jgi:ABC-2 type transport system permease protein
MSENALATPRCVLSAAPHPTFFSALRAEVLKSAHGAPVRLAVALALPFGLLGGIVLPLAGWPISYSAWNYYYMLLLPVTVSLASATVAGYDARLSGHVPLSCGVPLARTWVAKALWCLGLSLLGNLVTCALYTVGALLSPAGAASVASMLATALVSTVATSWMVPVTLFLVTRAGMLAGVLVPLGVQLVAGFAWGSTSLWPLIPPVAAAVLPTAFLPVLPSGEPMDAATGALAATLGRLTPDHALALVVCAVAVVALTALSALWFSRSEEL